MKIVTELQIANDQCLHEASGYVLTKASNLGRTSKVHTDYSWFNHRSIPDHIAQYQ